MIPTNEQETIALFAQLAQELGFKFVEVGTSCPDAIMQKDGQRIRVEFEHKAQNFERHKHPIENVDLIVCWEDNWQQSPLPVLSLKNYVLLAKPPSRWSRFLFWWQGIVTTYLEYRNNVWQSKIKNSKRFNCKVCGHSTQLKCHYEKQYRGFTQISQIVVSVAILCSSCGYVSVEVIDAHSPINWATGNIPDIDELQELIDNPKQRENPVAHRRAQIQEQLTHSTNGDRPTKTALAQEYGVSRTTIDRDLAALEIEL